MSDGAADILADLAEKLETRAIMWRQMKYIRM
jgi:hypothetical protein